jgi:nitrogen fixation/metabolism regulation signal transduction histidine kinase
MRVHRHSKGRILTANRRAERLLQRHTNNGLKNILFTDEKLFTIEEQYNHQNNKIYAQTSREVKESDLRVQRGHHAFYIMVWWGVSHQGVILLHFARKG